MRNRVVLLTWHYYNSKRRAGFHWLADALCKEGWEVIFFTLPVSWLSIVKSDRRMYHFPLRDRNKVVWIKERLGSYVWFTSWHPIHLGSQLLNRAIRPIYKMYSKHSLGPIIDYLPETDLFIFECGHALMLFERFKQINPSARYVYRVSDDQRLLYHHPIILETEERIAAKFNLISTPSAFLYNRFEHLPNSALQYHGLDKDVFDRQYPNPYKPDTINFVFVGNSHLDIDFVARAARLFPQYLFHIIGPLQDVPQANNVVQYGEMRFMETVPYLKYADAGLQTRAYTSGAESLTDSLKVLQYTYCQLPIIVPEFLHNPRRNNFFYYRPGNDDSIYSAVSEALRCDRTQIVRSDIGSWRELALKLIGNLS